tara:strand:+ start:64 stop:1956 length:1893 start_codon:yes stop_codon:yes gene_type:complete
MAVYRSDQALVTFGAEAVHGGYQELADATTHTDRTTLTAAALAGARSILVAATTTIVVGDFLRIGYETGTGSPSAVGQSHSEIRRVQGIDGLRLYLDSPLGFGHASGQGVVEATVSAGLAAFPAVPTNSVVYGEAIKFVPGIYDTVDVPDMETTFTPTYALGSTAKRNATFFYKGEQAFNGAIPAFSVLNGWPLRFPIGKITTVPSVSVQETNGLANCGANDEATTSLVTWSKGDMIISLPNGAPASADLYAALNINESTASNERKLLYINHSDYEEIVEVAELLTDPVVRLANPLRFDHKSSAAAADTFSVKVLNAAARTYVHTIEETSDLDSISMNVHMRDSGETAANDFDRRYYGGRIGSSVIAGEETGRLTMSWDGIQFMGMAHNQGLDVNFASGSTSDSIARLPRFNMMKTISDTEAWIPPNSVTSASPLGTAGEPFLFSQGQITLFGVPIATIRSFSLSISNSPEARYYIGGGGGNRNRGPYEIVNQRREYSLSMTAVEPYSRASDANAQSLLYEDGLGSSIFKEMLMEGDKDNGLLGASPEGLKFEIFISRDNEGSASSTDYIKIEPGYASGTSAPAFGLSTQGMFIQSAKYNLDGSNPIQADLDIVLRSVKITIGDSLPIYP